MKQQINIGVDVCSAGEERSGLGAYSKEPRYERERGSNSGKSMQEKYTSVWRIESTSDEVELYFKEDRGIGVFQRLFEPLYAITRSSAGVRKSRELE
ncbi:UNVERIFIED_CONTAM: hypothetical protein Sangu_0167900 [Sesamum angustifolium]|uniref:Uncharacterized protein n=1 Tax=Sesamum angustifolium TaxID=2727405 RepID=A0AAW2RLK0_9LAMI